MKRTAPANERRKNVKLQIPAGLYRQLRRLVDEGWFRSEQDIIDEALARFLSTHQPEMMEQALLEDVEWGLRGGK